MTLDEYQAHTQRTLHRPVEAYPEDLRFLDRDWQGAAALRLVDRLVLALGLAGEAGEVVDLIKKVAGHGKPLNLDDLKLELGDTLFYVAALANAHGLTLSQVAQGNVDKLRARYPDGFSVEASAARVDTLPADVSTQDEDAEAMAGASMWDQATHRYEGCCNDRWYGFVCTRPYGHAGNHVTSNGYAIHTRWAR